MNQLIAITARNAETRAITLCTSMADLRCEGPTYQGTLVTTREFAITIAQRQFAFWNDRPIFSFA